MAPRRRKEINRPLPPGLRCRAGYYSWTNPETGREFGLGRDRHFAVGEARAANAHIASKRPGLIERMTAGVVTWGEWCDTFEKKLAERESSANTIRSRRSYMKLLRSVTDPDNAAARVETRDCAHALTVLKDAGKHRTAQAFRSFMIDCFNRAIAEGIRKDNPAAVTDLVRAKVKRARLTLDIFRRVHKATTIPELKNAMALALVSGQARQVIAAGQFTEVKEGDWWVVRGKTEAHIRIPLTLRLDVIGLSLADVIADCRRTGVVSRYLIHRTRKAQGARIGSPLHVDILTRLFTAEITKLGLTFGDKEPPTFHEIRSLSARLYREQGNVNVQELLGHTEEDTTEIYTDGRGEWVKVTIKNG